MSGILTYVLHYEGEFNKNSLGAVSEAAKLAGELGQEAHAVLVGDGDDLTSDLAAQLGVGHRRPAVLDHDGLAVELPDVRKRLEQRCDVSHEV